MSSKWIEAGGEYQIPMIGSASRIVKGEYPVYCPKCKSELLRFYFHIFNSGNETGTLWAWCVSCRLTTHLPRVKSNIDHIKDPFSQLKLEDFAQIEMDPNQNFLDRLNQLWNEGKIRY